MATVKVSFEDPSFSFFDCANPLLEVLRSELMAASLASGVPISSVKDHPLINADRFKDARLSDAGFEVLELLSFDHRKHVGKWVGHKLKRRWLCSRFSHRPPSSSFRSNATTGTFKSLPILRYLPSPCCFVRSVTTDPEPLPGFWDR